MTIFVLAAVIERSILLCSFLSTELVPLIFTTQQKTIRHWPVELLCYILNTCISLNHTLNNN